jgi:hypothetical protein
MASVRGLNSSCSRHTVWRAFVNTVMNIRFCKGGEFLNCLKELLASQALCSIPLRTYLISLLGFFDVRSEPLTEIDSRQLLESSRHRSSPGLPAFRTLGRLISWLPREPVPRSRLKADSERLIILNCRMFFINWHRLSTVLRLFHKLVPPLPNSTVVHKDSH